MFNKNDLYYLPKLDCNIKFLREANTNYSIDLYIFNIVSGKHINNEVILMSSEIKQLKN